MDAFRALSTSEQLAEHLRREILRGGLGDTMPGIKQLVRMLGVNSRAAEAAVNQLEADQLVVKQGNRRRRRIVVPKDIAPPSLRIQILLHGEDDAKMSFMVDLLHQLVGMGHRAELSSRCLGSVGMKPQRIERFVRSTPADAWVVVGGSRDVLDWFASRSFPALALFGRMRSLPMAGVAPDKTSAFRQAARRLIELGHHRISLLVGEDRRKPSPGAIEQAFLDEMVAAGIPTSSYNLPDWPMHPEAFRRCLDSLFANTPPTALMIDTSTLFHAAIQYLAQRELLAPRDVSLICTDSDLTFAWCKPTTAHIQWDSRPVVRRVLRWANNIARGSDDLRKSFTKAVFVEGGTIGPVSSER